MRLALFIFYSYQTLSRKSSNPGAIAGNASAQKSMVHGTSYNVETFQENTTNLVCKIKFKVSATNVTNFQLVEDLPSIYNKYLKKTLKIPLKIECHFATSAHAERYVARLVRGWNPFEWVSLSSGYQFQHSIIFNSSPGVCTQCISKLIICDKVMTSSIRLCVHKPTESFQKCCYGRVTSYTVP